jgi:class 3 adenylate cyclase/tetratricopeptide (TPR) repeat protein
VAASGPELLAGAPSAAPVAHPLAPYLPRLVVDWLADEPERVWREVEGSVAFVDISGFTKLSERLSRRGRVGAEELTDAIGSCFVQLLAVAYAKGGSLLKFGGDALLLLFAGPDHAARASRAAVGMRRTLRDVGRMRVLDMAVQLRMSVGIHSGRFHLFLVGESHRELLVTGPAASETVVMESTATAGEIVVSAATAALLRPGVLGAAAGTGRRLRREPDGLSPHAPLAPVRPDLELAGAVPVAVRGVATGPVPPEHRRVTVAFVHFDDTDALIAAGPDEAARQLGGLVADVQRAAEHHEVCFLSSDIDRDGGKIILTAGAPLTTGDDEHRMLLALREIADGERDISLRIGVNRGSVFAGEIGPEYRRTFTVMGDVVNLAARLMAKAEPGQILATPDVVDRVGASVTVRELEPFTVKGKARPVRALDVGVVGGSRRQGDRHEDLPLVGRDVELAGLVDLSGSLADGRGRLVELVGDPGVGKSRLVEEVVRALPELPRHAMTCEPYDVSTPYFPFRSLLRGLFGIPAESDDESATARVAEGLASVSDSLVPWAPLFGAVLGLRIAETPETRQLEERFRPNRLADVTTQVLASWWSGPTLLTVEDAHWMDEASSELLRYLAGASTEQPWLIVAARRAGAGGFAAPLTVSESVAVEPLSADDALDLVRLATRHTPLAGHRAQELAERSGGNPLFLLELVATAVDGSAGDALPETIDAVIAARIDQLPVADRLFLRRVSVLGRSFPAALLPAVVEEVPGAGDLRWARLADFLRRDGDGTVSFAHGLLRDSAYDGLPYRERRQLHARAGDLVRVRAGAHVDEQAGLLSLHYVHARRFDEAWTYSLAAADRANAVYANVEAAEFYERAVESGRHRADVGPEDLASIWEALGDARHRGGLYADGERAYRTARRLAPPDAIVQARLALKLAQVSGWLDRYSGALRWITRGLRLLEGAAEPATSAAQAQRARLLAWYGRFCQEEGQHRRALRWAGLAVEAAEGADELGALADALKVIDWAAMDLGRLEEPVHWHRALGLFEDLGDLPSQASVLNMLGGLAYFRSRWTEALELYHRAQDMVRRTGNDVMDAFCRNNIGEIALEQGHLDEAEARFEEAGRMWRAAGYRSVAATAMCNFGRVARARGELADALALFEAALAETLVIGDLAEALEVATRQAECLLASGATGPALALVEESLTRSRTLGGVGPQVPGLQRVRGLALWMGGDHSGAGAAFESSLQAARARQADYEVALTLEALAAWRRHTGAGEVAPLEAERARILDRLGVVWTPELPVPV